jgi:hypothetical protein
MKPVHLPVLFLILILAACNIPSRLPTATIDQVVLPTSILDNTPSFLPSETLPPLSPTITPVTCPPFGTIEKGLPDNPQSTDFIGYSYLTLPPGFDEPTGWIIDSANPSPDGMDYALVVITGLPRDFLAFIQIPCNLPDGKAYYIILDVLDFPAPEENLVFASPETTCTLNGVPDYEIVAATRSNPNDFTVDPDPLLGYKISEVVQVWRANRIAHRFEEIPLDGIACYLQVMGP